MLNAIVTKLVLENAFFPTALLYECCYRIGLFLQQNTLAFNVCWGTGCVRCLLLHREGLMLWKNSEEETNESDTVEEKE